MSLKEQVGNVYSAGIGNVGSYQVSGIPYITGSEALTEDSEHKIEFPYVARSVSVINHSDGDQGDGKSTIRIHFYSKDGPGVNRVIDGLHYVELDTDEDSYTFNVKCKEIYISTPAAVGTRKYRVIAELTNIHPGRMYDLSASLDGVGITQ